MKRALYKIACLGCACNIAYPALPESFMIKGDFQAKIYITGPVN